MDTARETFLKSFFSSKFEMVYNKAVINGLKDTQVDPILSYINEIISIPLKDYVEYLVANPSNTLISSFNYTQISKIELCHTEMCDAFKRAGYKGLTAKEIGVLLHNGKVNEDAHITTDSKFGENVKGSSQLGLAIYKESKWYLSYFGYVYPSLDQQNRMALISRVLLRDPFYAHLFREASHRNVVIWDEMVGISDSTKLRRKGNILEFCKIVCNQANLEGEALFHQIISKEKTQK